MKTRHVYSTSDLGMTRAAMDAARAAGVEEDSILLVARSDIELDTIPRRHQEADTDFMPAALKGAAIGGGGGFLLGLGAIVLTPIGLTIAGIAAATLAGVAIGGLSSSLFGAALSDPVRRQFEDEIEAGRILLVIDTEDEVQAVAGPAIEATGAAPLPFDRATASVR